MKAAAFICLATLPLAGLAETGPQAPEPGTDLTPGWRDEKCARFERAWSAVLDGKGADMSATFVEGMDAFVTSRCELRTPVCPKPGPDMEAADMLALMVVSEGMTTSFLPIACP
ncbi:hypothetical protein [Maritimibacter sp. DP1N21-5]|uniref:hypothetical protein n=1 Tax=Maritimibacter sp. DP1N21-5 TaxID=2836867 RepID=UPI001C4559F7|nr:hypothetical protein [Maritimibacter sp. DP1N21-5]MBV7409526.1 hypothetical protein [Maritimibacter sp. DP1N21-5]